MEGIIENNTENNESTSQEISQENLQEVLQEYLIPENSKTLLVDETSNRFSSAVWFDIIKKKTITLAGVGGIGSFVAFLLARVKPYSIILYDNDIVDASNMSGQLYSMDNIGSFKVNAITDMITNYADYFGIFAIGEKFTRNSTPSDIMICGFDNMEARRIYFNSWMSYLYNKSDEEKAKCLFIDGRLSAEEFQIFCITGLDTYNQKRYSKDFLFEDAEAEETVCSYKQTTFCANMIASYIVNLFVNFCAIEANGYRSLPFFTRYDASTMFLKIED